MKNFLELANEEISARKEEIERRNGAFAKSFPKLHYALENTPGVEWELKDDTYGALLRIVYHPQHVSELIESVFDWNDNDLVDHIVKSLFL